MIINCTKRIEFDAGHRVMEHENKCRMLHGHRYALEATFVSKKSTDQLDKLGRVVDFGEIKKILGKWINENFDHNIILNSKDKELGNNITKITNQKIYYLPYNPTAENIIYYLIKEIVPKLIINYPVMCSKLKLYETPNCYAEIIK